MNSLSLECKPFSGSHTASAIADISSAMLAELKIPEKNVEAFVTDNGANNVAAFRDHSSINRNSCLAHTLDLMARKILNSPLMKDALTAARGVVGHFKRSALNTKQLDQFAKIAGINVATRWGSTNTSLATLKMKPALQAMYATGKLKKYLTSEQWKQIDQCIKLLEPFAEAQQYTEGEKYVNLAFIPFILTALKRHLDKIVSNNDELEAVRNGAKLLAKDLYSHCFGVVTDCDDISILPAGYMPQSVLLAAVCDPRTKYFKNLGSSDYSRAKELLLERMTERGEEIRMEKVKATVAATAAVAEADEQDKGKDDETKEDEPPTHRNDLQRMLASLSDSEESESEEEAIADREQVALLKSERLSELSAYFNKQSYPALGTEKDPLAWWKDNAAKFLLISYVARAVLATPATSAPSERLFSQSGMIVTPRRNRLLADRLEQLMFLRGSWLAGEKYSKKTERAKKAEAIMIS